MALAVIRYQRCDSHRRIRRWKSRSNRRHPMTRTSNWLLKTTFVLAAIAMFLAVSFGETLATLVTVHQSTEDFYSTGGTRVSGCIGQGCQSSSFTFGDTTGPLLGEANEKVFEEQTLASGPITAT